MSVIPSDIRIYAAYAEPAYDGSTTLSAAITSTTATSLTVTAAGSFPQTGEFLIEIDSELLLVTQGAGTTTWTVIRGVLGSTAATHLISATVTTVAGGPVCMYGKLAFSDIVSGDTADYLSSSASDTLVQLALTGRDTTGVLQTETKTLTGQTVVSGTQVWDRFEKVRLAAGTTASALITNAGTSLSVTSAANFPGTGTYYIQMGLEILQVTAGAGTTTWTVSRGQNGTTASAHNSGDNIYLLPVGDVAIVDHTKVVSSHTTQAGSTNPTGSTPALIKLQAGDGATVSIGQIVVTTGGTGPNQIRTIIATSGYGTDVVAVSRAWGTVPDNTTIYSVYNGFQLDVAPNPIINVHRFLWNAQADSASGSTRNFYQLGYVVNDNTTTAFTAPSGFTGVQHEVTAFSPSLPTNASSVAATLSLALATALNGTTTWATRQTAPGSGFSGFTQQPAALTQTANSGNLPPGASPNAAGAQGVAFQLTLPPGCAPYKGSATYQVQGATT